MSKQKMLDAKALIADKRYDEARSLLEDINHPKAREMMAQIERETSQRQSRRGRDGAAASLLITVVISVLLTAVVIAALVLVTRPAMLSRLVMIGLPPPSATQVASPETTPDTSADATAEATAASETDITGVVRSNQSINVRSGAGTQFPALRSVQPGVEVIVLSQNADGSWLNVRLSDGTEGWVSAALLSLSEPLPTPTSGPAETAAALEITATAVECSGTEGSDWWASTGESAYVQSRYFLTTANSQDASSGMAAQRQALVQAPVPECAAAVQNRLLSAMDDALEALQTGAPPDSEQALGALTAAGRFASETFNLDIYSGTCPLDSWEFQIRAELRTLAEIVASLDIPSTTTETARSTIFDLRRARAKIADALYAPCVAPAREQALALTDAASGLFQGVYEGNQTAVAQNQSLMNLAYRALVNEFNRLNYRVFPRS